MIEARGLRKAYRDRVAIEDVSFTVASGEVVGLLGPNGAGKTTTLRILAGAIPPSAGSAIVAGRSVDEPPRHPAQVGYLPERPPLYPDLTVLEYLRFIAVLKRIPRRALDAEVARAIELAALGDVRGRLLGHLSKGFQQRTGLAQALLGRPPVLILDEPTVGLDPRQIGEVRRMLRQLAGEHTILLSTHVLPEVVAVCSRVLIINRGRVVLDQALDAAAIATPDPKGSGLEHLFLSLTEV